MANKYKAASEAAQERHRKLRACDRKRAYATEAAAYQKGQTSYQCPYCNQWHRSGSFTSLVNKLKNRSASKAKGKKQSAKRQAIKRKATKRQAHQKID